MLFTSEKSKEKMSSSSSVSDSSTSDDKLFCYECQTFRPAGEVQKIKCSNCNGQKCWIHGGESVFTCEHCKTENLCINCHMHVSCCHDFDPKSGKFEFVGRRVVLLQKKIDMLERENKQFRLKLISIQDITKTCL